MGYMTKFLSICWSLELNLFKIFNYLWSLLIFLCVFYCCYKINVNILYIIMFKLCVIVDQSTSRYSLIFLSCCIPSSTNFVSFCFCAFLSLIGVAFRTVDRMLFSYSPKTFQWLSLRNTTHPHCGNPHLL